MEGEDPVGNRRRNKIEGETSGIEGHLRDDIET